MQRQFFPTDEDESGAARALMRLQDTYKLDPDTISRGDLPGEAPCLLLSLQCSGRSDWNSLSVVVVVSGSLWMPVSYLQPLPQRLDSGTSQDLSSSMIEN